MRLFFVFRHYSKLPQPAVDSYRQANKKNLPTHYADISNVQQMLSQKHQEDTPKAIRRQSQVNTQILPSKYADSPKIFKTNPEHIPKSSRRKVVDYDMMILYGAIEFNRHTIIKEMARIPTHHF
ncbi:hypothetical protein CIK93_03310 [Prevotella sp. P3-92]|nr:hypothetical protein CIK93_03310 [Prevotella sp. P3-92]